MMLVIALLPCACALVSPRIFYGRIATRLASPMTLVASTDTDLGDATTELLQCMADADNGDDIEACELAYDDVFNNEQGKSGDGESKTAMDSADRAKLWSANGEFLDCVADASNGEEIESCEMDYDAAYTEVVEKQTEFCP